MKDLVTPTTNAAAVESASAAAEAAAEAGGVNGPSDSARTVKNAPGSSLKGVTTGGGADQRPTAGAPLGVTGGTISLGILVQDFSGSASAFAIKDSVYGDQKAQAQATINFINNNGGIAGRKVVPVFHVNNAQNGTFASQAQAACSTFTEDHHVFAVTPSTFDMTDLVACLARHNTPLVAADGSFGYDADQAEMDQYGDYLYAPNVINFSRLGFWIDHLADVGFLKPTTPIGVLYMDEPQFRRTLDNVVRPHLAARGLQLTDAASIANPSNEADVSGDAAGASSAVLRFRSKGITRILFVESQPVIPFLFLPEAQAQGYHPLYGLSTYDGPEWLSQNAPAVQLAGAVGLGWMPARDVGAAQDPGGNPGAAQCMDIMKRAGVETDADRSEALSALWFCSDLFFLKAALDRAPAITPAGLRAGVEALGRTWTSPLNFGNLFGPRRHDGAAEARPFTFNSGCGCFQYSGGASQIP